MAKLIPNQQVWVGWKTSIANGGTTMVVTAADVSGATDLTSSLISINASAAGNTVPTPALDSLFETSVSGTVQAQFSMDLYRDDTSQTVFNALARGNSGYVMISRLDPTPTSGENTVVEAWPVTVTARTPSALTSNTAQTFTVTCAVTAPPNEGAAMTA
jgi:hypothetical protein